MVTAAMERTVVYVEVAVDVPMAPDRTLTYSVPPGMRLQPGTLVWVPLLARPVQGVVFKIGGPPQVEKVKQVLATIGRGPMVPDWRLELCRAISREYRSSLFEAVALMLPPGYKNKVGALVSVPEANVEEVTRLVPEAASLIQKGISPREITQRDMERALGRRGSSTLTSLMRRGLVRRTWIMPRPRVSAMYRSYLRLATESAPLAGAETQSNRREQALLRGLTESNEALSTSQANKEYGAAAVNSLVKKGLLAQEWVKTERPLGLDATGTTLEPVVNLTPAQSGALEEISLSLADSSRHPREFLLHGVTGSGKTEVYLRALEQCVAHGRQGIFLVPEISLTPQTVHRLSARFPGRLAMMHSKLSPGAMFDQWWHIGDGDLNVVLGPRSAVFAPLPDPGLIVIDEEHEWAYKQHDPAPRYHAREVALEIARLNGAVVLMGSATPDVSSYYKASHGGYRLLELPDRISPLRSSSSGHAKGRLPYVEVKDMREELKRGNSGIFCKSLTDALRDCVSSAQQAILFLNRRGSATVTQCRDCGHVFRCRNCSSGLTYHASEERLRCHYCGRKWRTPERCTRCRGARIRYMGWGVQRVAEEAARVLPGVAISRWDSDSAANTDAHQKIMARFESGQTSVLVGTQMVAKGLHVPNVSLVGVVLADVGLTLPDFRAGERVFQLLFQVVGRAGRGSAPGRAIIQTYNPDHYAVASASAQDYDGFYRQELEYRRQHGNPPFGSLARLAIQHTNLGACQEKADSLGRRLRHRIATLGLANIQVIGPAPRYPERVRGNYRWHLVLRGANLHALLDGMNIPPDWTVDMHPLSVA